MGHGSPGGRAIKLIGHGAGGAGAPGDIGGPGPQQGAGGALGPAGTEFAQRPALGGPDHPVGLGGGEGLVVQGQKQIGLNKLGHEGLVVQGQKQIGLNKLGLDGGGPDGEDGLPREDGGALRHGGVPSGTAQMSPVKRKSFR